MQTHTDPYETDDIYLAAYFLLCGCVMGKRRKVGNKVIFVFTNPAGPMNDLREDYYSGKAMVRANAYAMTVVSVKKLCFDAG